MNTAFNKSTPFIVLSFSFFTFLMAYITLMQPLLLSTSFSLLSFHPITSLSTLSEAPICFCTLYLWPLNDALKSCVLCCTKRCSWVNFSPFWGLTLCEGLMCTVSRVQRGVCGVFSKHKLWKPQAHLAAYHVVRGEHSFFESTNGEWKSMKVEVRFKVFGCRFGCQQLLKMWLTEQAQLFHFYGEGFMIGRPSQILGCNIQCSRDSKI